MAKGLRWFTLALAAGGNLRESRGADVSYAPAVRHAVSEAMRGMPRPVDRTTGAVARRSGWQSYVLS